jgi:TetR/AcrR family transcriptional repressor of nem operon
MSVNAKEAILLAAKKIAQSQGYNGLNFRDLAQAVGIKAVLGGRRARARDDRI